MSNCNFGFKPAHAYGSRWRPPVGMAWRHSEEHGKQRHEASWGWESREANFMHNRWWADWRPGTETPSDCWVWMTPYSPWWRPASDAARQGCPAHLEGGTWSSANASTQTLQFKRNFKITVGALTYIYIYIYTYSLSFVFLFVSNGSKIVQTSADATSHDKKTMIWPLI